MQESPIEDVVGDRVRPLLRSEYEKLIELGVFAHERLELLRGRLVTMSPQKGPHASTVSRLNRLFTLALAERADVRVQLPLAVSDDSEPEPDIAVVAIGDYDHEHPSTALLVIEVADASLRGDQQLKGALYAEAGIAEYWIVNLAERLVEVYREPDGGRYRLIQRYGSAEAVAPAQFPELSVRVDAVLPRIAS